jgi:hypothetical protein
VPERYEESTQNFNRTTWRKEAIWEAQTEIGGDNIEMDIKGMEFGIVNWILRRGVGTSGRFPLRRLLNHRLQ